MEKNFSEEIPDNPEEVDGSETSSANSPDDRNPLEYDIRSRDILTKDQFYEALSNNTWSNFNSLSTCLRNIHVELVGYQEFL
jgi:hypothetical protein